ncbi:Chaperone protein YajL [Aliarcobacter thereius]|uniref:Chaperone protein YajL n=1 Tax=Aliarcobacter thereius LMG 24486 TaxID=1032240 RepID=A0A1C7WMZ1_9BACT|nr:DJ-1 family glyoxalase III [Aliarcobacter thereius]OCL88474.1 Chaperone protein YajL [Aliarcobacter thereius]OCL91964.1 Chaperone protein YajL [Aliarcobacter thereius]OCL94938.1 Chaperone protein YajL [Aliarcobacter thereius LMG 24486]QBF15190.1 DJ-1 family protein [Aliarcobacter thereius LMG 24486]TLS93004.1 DJ-1/PfpI family protein [Aliarcobacter thereius]
MAKILVAIADGFEEIEAINIIDICRRADINVVSAGVENKILTGAHNIKIEMDKKIDELCSDDFDMIVLPGGLPNAFTLAEDKSVQKLLKEFKVKNKKIAAICTAPYALHKAEVLEKNYTCYPSFETKIRLDGYKPNEDVVIDGNIITSRGPATATKFALELVKILKGEEIYKSVKDGLLA